MGSSITTSFQRFIYESVLNPTCDFKFCIDVVSDKEENNKLAEQGAAMPLLEKNENAIQEESVSNINETSVKPSEMTVTDNMECIVQTEVATTSEEKTETEMVRDAVSISVDSSDKSGDQKSGIKF